MREWRCHCARWMAGVGIRTPGNDSRQPARNRLEAGKLPDKRHQEANSPCGCKEELQRGFAFPGGTRGVDMTAAFTIWTSLALGYAGWLIWLNRNDAPASADEED
jgi:hypothetical protein